MRRHKGYLPQGVIPAALLPFNDDLSIDESAYRAHLRDVASAEGLSAVTVNAHASEVASCSFEEQVRVLALTQDAVGDRLPVVHGIYADGSLEAARVARMADAGGAAALLVFPSAVFALGQGPDMVLAHFKRIADATDLPLVAFQYQPATGWGYPLATLLRLLDEVPSVRAIKDWSGNVPLHERTIRLLQGRSPRVSVLTTHSAWLMSSLVLGCDGLLSGSGSVIAGEQAAMFRAVKAGDLKAAQAINDRIHPLMEAFYAEPFADMHNRMKEALVMLGRLPRAVVRPPLAKLRPAEIERIRAALAHAGLLPARPAARHAAE